MNARYVLPVLTTLAPALTISRRQQTVHGASAHFATVTRKEYPTTNTALGRSPRRVNKPVLSASVVGVAHFTEASTGNGSAARQTAATVRQPGAITRTSLLPTTPASYRRRGFLGGADG